MFCPRNLLRAWLGGTVAGMLLLAAGQFYYEGRVVGVRQYQILMFVDLPYGTGGADFQVFIDGKLVRTTFVILPSESAFVRLYGAGPVRSTKERVSLELVPRSQNPAHRAHRFQIENAKKERVCDAVVEVRGAEPTFLGCSDRIYHP